MSDHKAILVVSFGTSYTDTREKTINQIERAIRKAYPEYSLYRAWTSKKIIAKLMKRDGVQIPTVKEALETMLADGIQELVVQPTHIINGIENDQMKETVLKYAEHFTKVSFGTPLLTSIKDHEKVLQAVIKEFPELTHEDALVLMGHGTAHYANAVYGALNYMLWDMGHVNVFIGTVESYPSLETVLKQMKAFAPENVILAPFMVVAGDHALNDMAGEEEDSWKNCFKKAGFQVGCRLQGLGEYESIRQIYVEHVEDAIRAE